MARARTLVAVLASLALAACAEPREDDVTLVQQGVRRADDITEGSDTDTDVTGDLDEESDASVTTDLSFSGESEASVIGQGVAAFAGAVQAIMFEMTMGKHYAAHAPAEAAAQEPSPGKCTEDERLRANHTVVRLAMEMLSSSRNRNTADSLPAACPKDPVAVAAALAFNSGNFAQCMQQLLGVSEPCSGCMVSFVNSARGCLSQCVPMLTGCGNPSTWSENSDKAKCPEKSSACLACNVPHMKSMTECSGAFPQHRQDYYKFLDGAIGLVKDGSLVDPEKLKDYMVQFVKKTQG